MKFEINVHPHAAADLEQIHEYIGAYSSDAADRHYAMLKHSIMSLSDFPKRCAVAPESKHASIEIRHLIVGNYRILYSIIYQTVHVARVVHGSQSITAKDLF